MANDIGKAMEVLKQILGDEDAKENLMNIVGNLAGNTGGDSEDEDYPEEAEIQAEDTENEDEEDQETHVSGGADSFLPSLLGTLDIQSLYDTMVGSDDHRIRLLNALRPYLNEHRSGKIDSAIRVMQIASISSTLGLNKIFQGK